MKENDISIMQLAAEEPTKDPFRIEIQIWSTTFAA